MTIKGKGVFELNHRINPVNWKRAVLRKTAWEVLPEEWKKLDDKLYGTTVAIPANWTPRVRGDAMLFIEQDRYLHTSAFFLPLRLNGKVTAAQLASGFAAMLRLALPSWKSTPMESPSLDFVQRNVSASVEHTLLVGVYRAVVGKRETAFVMGYVAPVDRVGELRSTFHRILSSYRYTRPQMILHPYRSPGNAIELRIPRGWQVATSEGTRGAKPEVEWEVRCPHVDGARTFMSTRISLPRTGSTMY